jgi:uncharacterized SAM-binding protein YcdF (DUF218 family)
VPSFLENFWCFLNRESWFRTAAEFWIISDAVESADAVAILGGDPGPRSLAAAEYYQKGLVRRVLISAGHSLVYLRPSVSRQVAAVRLGVPESAIDVFGTNPLNTYLEAVALKKWVLENGADCIIVPTEIFSARRVRWIFSRKLAAIGTRVLVPAVDTEYYGRDNYWESDQALHAFRTEVLKYLYYRLKYWTV